MQVLSGVTCLNERSIFLKQFCLQVLESEIIERHDTFTCTSAAGHSDYILYVVLKPNWFLLQYFVAKQALYLLTLRPIPVLV